LLNKISNPASIGKLEIPLKELTNAEPATVRDAIIFYFLEGGRVNTEDFVRATGFSGEDMRPYIWAVSNSAPWASDIIHQYLAPSIDEQQFDKILAEREFWDIVLRGKTAMIDEATAIYKANRGELDYPENYGSFCNPSYVITYTDRYSKCRVPYSQFGDEAAMKNMLVHIKESKKRGEQVEVFNPRIKRVAKLY